MHGLMRPRFYCAAATSALAFAGGLLSLGCTKTPAEGQSSGPPPALVAVGEVGPGQVELEWSFLGDVQALQRAELAAGAAGEVRRVLVRVGDRVKKGELLLEVDPSLASARVRAAEASRRAGHVRAEQATRDAQRLERAGSDVVSGAEIEGAGAQVEELTAERQRLRAAAGEARAELGRHRLRAPFDGVVATRLVDPGDWVDQGTQVMEFVDDAGVEVLVNAPLEAAIYIEEGHPATLERNGVSVPATVRGIVKALDARSRTVRVRLTPDTQPPWLLAGAAVDVRIRVTREEEGALTVPRDALVYDVAGARVMKIADNKAVPINVEVVARGRGRLLVRGDDLQLGDRVVTRGNERLRPGQPVSILPEE